MRRCIAIVISTILSVLVLSACGQSQNEQWQEQYDLGVRYLSEGNYEEAIIAFTAAIEIDPKRTETYIQLAETFSLSGDLEQALDILNKGLAETGNDSIEEFMIEFLSANTSLFLDDENVADVHDFKVNSKAISESTIGDFEVVYPSASEEEWYYDPIREYEQGEESGIQYVPRTRVSDNSFTDWGVSAWSASMTNEIRRAIFDMDTYHPEIDFRGIQLGDLYENVLESLGFRETELEYIGNFGMPYITIDVAGKVELSFLDVPQHYQENNITEVNIYDNQAGGWLILQFSEGILSFIQFNSLS